MGVQWYNHKTQKTLTISRKVVFATKYIEIMTAKMKILSQSLMLLVGTYQCKSALSPLPLVYCWVVYVQHSPHSTDSNSVEPDRSASPLDAQSSRLKKKLWGLRYDEFISDLIRLKLKRRWLTNFACANADGPPPRPHLAIPLRTRYRALSMISIG